MMRQTPEQIANDLLSLPDELDDKSIRDACDGDRDLENSVRTVLHDITVGDQILHRIQNALGAPTPTSGPEAGLILDGYELTESIATGGFGEVWKALDPMGQLCIVKFARSVHGSEIGENESLILQSVSRIEGVATFLGAGEYNTNPYIVMEFVDGLSLAEIDKPVKPDTALEWIDRIAAVTERLHTCSTPGSSLVGFAHGDITPRNIMIHPSRGPVLVDLGAAFGLRTNYDSVTSTLVSLTPAGHSPDYRVPEVTYGVKPTAAADIYQLASVAFELLSGRRYADVCEQGEEQDAWREMELLVNRRIVGVLRKALCWKPSDRYQNGAEFRAALRRARRPKISWLLSISGSLLAATVFAMAFPTTPSDSSQSDETSNLPQQEKRRDNEIRVPANSKMHERKSGEDVLTADRMFRSEVMPAIHKYLDFDNLITLSSDEFTALKELQLVEAIGVCYEWLVQFRDRPQAAHVKRWMEWLNNCNDQVDVVVQLGFVSEGTHPKKLIVASGEQRKSYEIHEQDGPKDAIIMRLKSHQPLELSIVNSNGESVLTKRFVSLMLFHRGKIPASPDYHYEEDGWEIHGRIIIDDAPIAPFRRPRMRRGP